jgi:hypothetical protein
MQTKAAIEPVSGFHRASAESMLKTAKQKYTSLSDTSGLITMFPINICSNVSPFYAASRLNALTFRLLGDKIVLCFTQMYISPQKQMASNRIESMAPASKSFPPM